jgi:glycosyltransferase involved in cell wall biosynthesis
MKKIIMTGKLNIAIICTNSFPVPMPNLHTGDLVIVDLVQSLEKLGHYITFIAPEKSYNPQSKTGRLIPIRASFGKYPPALQDCEQECFNKYADILRNQDIVHDFSTFKTISNNLFIEGKKVIQTLMGGAWTYDTPPRNLVVWSTSHRDRVLRGATDYEGTSTPDVAGHTGKPVKEARIVNGGINTEFYTPTYDKEDYFLWMGRWHPARGYELAIELAKRTGINLIMAGEHPDNELFENQKQCALHAQELVKGVPNIKFSWLPKDPDHHTAKRELFRRAKAFLHLNQFCEPFGLSQTEALACGTPVIGTNYGSISEVIKDGISGFVCDNEIEEYSKAINKIHNIDLKKCREEAVMRFDIKVMAGNYLKQYSQVINGLEWGSNAYFGI